MSDVHGYGDTEISECMIGGIHVHITGSRKVRIDGREDVPPALARQIARMLVSIADAAEKEPDPAEVAELANVIDSEQVVPGLDLAHRLARAVLRAGWKREAGS